RLCIGDPDRAHVVGHLGPAEETEGLADPFERDGGDLGAVVLLGEGQQQMIRRLAELLPVDLQEGGPMEDRARRVALDQLGPVPPLEVAAVLAEDDAHERPCYGPRARYPTACGCAPVASPAPWSASWRTSHARTAHL